MFLPQIPWYKNLLSTDTLMIINCEQNYAHCRTSPSGRCSRFYWLNRVKATFWLAKLLPLRLALYYSVEGAMDAARRMLANGVDSMPAPAAKSSTVRFAVTKFSYSFSLSCNSPSHTHSLTHWTICSLAHSLLHSLLVWLVFFVVVGYR